MMNQITAKEGPRRKRFSLVPQLDQYPWLVEFAQTIPGKFVVLAVFSGLLYFFWPAWVLFISACLFFCTFLPRQRHIILVVASLTSLLISRTYLQWDLIGRLAWENGVSGPFLNKFGAAVAVGIIFFCCFLLAHFSRGNRSGFRLRRPILLMILLYVLLTWFVSTFSLVGPVKFGIWVFLLLFGKYMWFVCYSLNDSSVPSSPPFWEQIGHYLPFWAVWVLPFHRGGNNLLKIKATSPVDMAVCQLKGLKLLIWASYLSIFSLLYLTFCHGHAQDFAKLINIDLMSAEGPLNVFFRGKLIYKADLLPFFLNLPPYDYAYAQAQAGRPMPFYWNWIAALGEFFLVVVQLAIVSHAFIAILRMAGYKALRNVYRPLSSKTVADFWNHYFYYFKELLVTIFFYPTFLRYFRNSNYLRYYFATVAAAGFGNFLYHFLVDFESIINNGFFSVLSSMHSYAFYCFILSNALFVSQWRKLKGGVFSKGLPWPLNTIGVLLFYCVAMIFAYHKNWNNLAGNIKFFQSLFNF